MPEDSPWAYNNEDIARLWQRFLAAVWDSLGQGAARDIVSFRRLCEKLWSPFIQPILNGHYGPKEFSKLLVKNRALLQGESALQDSIITNTPSLEKSKATTRKFDVLTLRPRNPPTDTTLSLPHPPLRP